MLVITVLLAYTIGISFYLFVCIEEHFAAEGGGVVGNDVGGGNNNSGGGSSPKDNR